MNVHKSVRWLFVSTIVALLIVTIFGGRVSRLAVGQGPGDPPQAELQGLQSTAAVPGGPGYTMQPASAFRPRYSSTEYQLVGPRLYTISGSFYYDAPLDLPNGADVTRLVIYYTDNDAAEDFSAEIWRVPMPGRSGEKVSDTVSSSGASADASFVETTSILLPTVDLEGYAYYIRLTLPASGDLEVNGFRVDYTYDSMLPLVTRE